MSRFFMVQCVQSLIKAEQYAVQLIGDVSAFFVLS